MKKLVLLFFFSIFLFNSQGQTSVYHPFADSGIVWREQYYSDVQSGCCCSGAVCLQNEQHQYFIDGDTLIRLYSYKTVWETGEGFFSISGPPFCPPWCTGCNCYSFYKNYSG